MENEHCSFVNYLMPAVFNLRWRAYISLQVLVFSFSLIQFGNHLNRQREKNHKKSIVLQ